MSIAKLYVEGDLDIQSLSSVLHGDPLLQRGGSKYSLKARAGTDRRENLVAAAYLRDRDFDFDPPSVLSVPTIDSRITETGDPLGWRWCRHEIENYLIDPSVVTEVMRWHINDYRNAICSAASRIRDYEIARWTVGRVRRSLPPHFDLCTRPDELSDIALPASLAAADVFSWASESVDSYGRKIDIATSRATTLRTIEELRERFNTIFLADVDSILLWFSGKDLLAALHLWLQDQGITHPGALRARIRDWIKSNPDRAIELLPEWNGLIQVLRK